MSRWPGWPEGADNKLPYLTMTALTSFEDAAKIFERRFGKPPQFVFEASGMVWAGPVPEAMP